MIRIYTYIVLVLLFYFLPVSALPDNPDCENFASVYEDLVKDHTERFFLGNGIVSESDINKVVSLYECAEVKNNPLYYARIQYMEAFLDCYGYRINIPKYEQIMNLTDEALKVITLKKYPEEHAKILYIRGLACLRTGLLENAYQHFDRALQLFEKNDDYMIYTISTYNRLAEIWRNLEKYDEALESLEKAKELSLLYYGKPDYYLDMNIKSIYTSKGEHKKVIESIKEELRSGEYQSDTTLMYLHYRYLGDNYSKINEPDSAMRYYQLALGVITDNQIHLQVEKLYTLLNIGKLYFDMGEYDKAEHVLLGITEPIKAHNLKAMEYDVYYTLYMICKKKGDEEKSNYYMGKSLELKVLLDENARIQQMKTNRSKIEIIRYQENLTLNTQKAKTTQAYIFSATLALFLVVIIISFVLFYISRKKKMKELENEQLTQRLKNEELKNRWEKAEHEREIEQKERELEQKEREMATSNLLINEKNKIYDLILKTIKPYYDSNKIPVKLWNSICAITSSGEQNEKDWEMLKVHFEKVHPDFYKKLKSISAELTEYELRICSYIRIGMGAKQIASMLMVNHHSVITSRYRIRKKLGLEKKESLDDFIRNI